MVAPPDTAHDEDPTDDALPTPWAAAEAIAAREAPHLVVAWILNEPWRVGHSASLERACWLGRGAPQIDDRADPLIFREQRPGQALSSSALTHTGISRRQLAFEPAGGGRVLVRRTGKRRLLHNGGALDECVASPGDTLMLENVAVFVVEQRPAELPALRSHPAPSFAFGEADPRGLVGESPAAWRLREALAMAAASSAHVLIRGPSGAGKEMAAATIHALSKRGGRPAVARSAATIPETLIDAELFGSARGYPNAGAPEREGLVGAAHGTTLVLDEIGELPEQHQAHLLRVLDSGGEYHRLGEARTRRSDLRLIAMTNRDPSALKHDLLARLGVQIEVPGLGARRSDIPLLMRALLPRLAADTPAAARFFEQRPRAPSEARLAPELVERLLRHDFTLHTRELERLLRIALTTSPGDYLTLTPELEAELRPTRISRPPGAADGDGTEDAGTLPTRDAVVAALAATGGNATRAAEQLGMSRHALGRLRKRLGIE